MKDKLNKIKQSFEADLRLVASSKALDDLEIKYFGRKSGELTNILRGLKDLPVDQKKEIGQLANEIKVELEEKLAAARKDLKMGGAAELDLTLPGAALPEGHLHIVTQAVEEISQIFERIGFVHRRYPEVDWDYYAFEALNMPPDHPARDEWETFFIDKKPVGPKGQRVLTPHTSNGQVREMERGQLPIRMTNISKCYRRQIDVSHVPMFHQFEGLVIDEHITIAHLKGVLDYFVKEFFGPGRQVRIRPYHFQFTEPSFEIDISVEKHAEKMGKGGWLELGGAGMVHPNVLKAGGIDPKKYSGFAFGWGVERCYLMKSGLNISDLRTLYKNDLRFLNQF